jgi:transcription antitermination factor NusG
METVNTILTDIEDSEPVDCAAHLDVAHYAIQVRYQYERIVEESLKIRGFSPFLPMFKRRRRWSDRVMETETPLFPGYIFCAFDLKNRLPVLSSPGVVGIVGAGKRPVPVDSNELAAVRAMTLRGIDVQPCSALPGQRIRIGSGPLEGLEGALLEIRGKHRLVVRISILNRSISAIIDGSEVLPI